VVGVGVQIVAVAFGAGAIVVASPPLFFAIKVLGAGFLIYLGISAFRHRADPLEVSGSDSKVNAKRILSQSFVVGITNAKTLVFFLAAFPQFVSEDGNPITQMLLMGLIFSVIGFFSDSVYAVAAGKARYWFADSGKRLAVLRGAGGILLAILGVYMLVSAFLR
jgi:threonine/homoserine/homoserine lactone efflux protein